MSTYYYIKFAALDEKITEKQAKAMLASHLKFSESQAEQFLSGALSLSSQSRQKVLNVQQRFKQQGILVTVGNRSTVPPTGNTSSADKHIVSALDYITTSIIRLEEKIDDLARQQHAQTDEGELNNEQASKWVAEFINEKPEPMTIETAKIKWIFILLLVMLLILLGVVIAFPNLLSF